MRTILVKPTIPTPNEIVSPTLSSPLGRYAFSYRAQAKRPLRRFTLQFAAHEQADAERVEELVTYSGGHLPVWFDSNAWAEITTPVLVWIGAGGDNVEYILPYKNVFPPTCVFYENGVIKSDWQMPDDGVSGITVFDTAPAEGAEITFQGIRKIKGILTVNRESVYSGSEIAPRLHRQGFQLEEVA